LVQVTVLPTLTETVAGLNAKFWIATAVTPDAAVWFAAELLAATGAEFPAIDGIDGMAWIGEPVGTKPGWALPDPAQAANTISVAANVTAMRA
jgi:hypothetical protein